MRKEGCFALYQGKEYAANYDIEEKKVVLYSRVPKSLDQGFKEVRKGFFVKRVERSDIQSAYEISTYAEYQGHKFRLDSIMNQKVQMSYSGPEPSIPYSLGFDCVEPHVYVKEVAEDEVTRIWQEATPLWGFSLPPEQA